MWAAGVLCFLASLGWVLGLGGGGVGGGLEGRGGSWVVCVSIHPSIQFPRMSSGTDGGLAGGHSYFFSLLGRKREGRGNERGMAGAGGRPLQTRARSQQPHRAGTAYPGQNVDGEREGRDRDWEREERKPAN